MWLSRWRYGEALWRGFLTSYRSTPLRISSLKPVFQRDKYEEYILYTTGRGPVSGVPLKSNLYVLLRVVYGAKCSTDFLLLLSLFEKEEISCMHEDTATNGSTLSDSGMLITTRCVSCSWFGFYSNLTSILDDSLATYLLRRIWGYTIN